MGGLQNDAPRTMLMTIVDAQKRRTNYLDQQCGLKDGVVD